jgi:hypothetical protein
MLMNHTSTTAMTLSDQRRQERYRLLRQPDSPLYVRTPTLRTAAMAVKDVSRGGVSVYLERDFPTSSRVSIEFTAPAIQLEVQGLVAWCRPRQESDTDARHEIHAFVLGIELFSPMMLLSAFRDALPVQALVMDGL